jgi:hypothetical protein
MARTRFRVMLAEHRAEVARQEAARKQREAAALEVIAPWAATFRDRCLFLRLRCDTDCFSLAISKSLCDLVFPIVDDTSLGICTFALTTAHQR